jgi:broad specificity phosphatase PhoE
MIDISFINQGNKNTAILIRHSERNHIPDGVHDIITPINAQGEIIATELGKTMRSFESIKIISSPVDRCVQTGNAIMKGFGTQSAISYSNLLGDPGPFVFDCEVAKDHFINMTCKTVVETQIAHKELAGIRPIEEGSEILKRYIVLEMQNNTPNNLLIFITHDAILAPFIFQYTGEKFNHEHWIDFIDGVAFIEKSEQVFLIRNGKEYELY